MEKKVTISITEITVLSGKTKRFKLNVDGQNIFIPVDEALFIHYLEQFYRESPTQDQRKRFSTLFSLLRAAYKKGVQDGKKSMLKSS